MATCADLYASEHKEEFREHRDSTSAAHCRLSGDAWLPPPFQTRPSLATRLYVRSSTRRILPALVDELEHWTPATRLLSAKLLRLLLVFCEDSMVDQLPTLLPALLKALAWTDTQDEELTTVLGHCARLLGWILAVSSESNQSWDMAALVPEAEGTRDHRARDRLLAHLRAGMGGECPGVQ